MSILLLSSCWLSSLPAYQDCHPLHSPVDLELGPPHGSGGATPRGSAQTLPLVINLLALVGDHLVGGGGEVAGCSGRGVRLAVVLLEPGHVALGHGVPGGGGPAPDAVIPAGVDEIYIEMIEKNGENNERANEKPANLKAMTIM